MKRLRGWRNAKPRETVSSNCAIMLREVVSGRRMIGMAQSERHDARPGWDQHINIHVVFPP